MINNSSPRWISTKPSGGNVAHGVLKAPVHSAGSSPRHRPSDFSRPPATMVGRKHNPSGETERKTSKKSIVEAWYYRGHVSAAQDPRSIFFFWSPKTIFPPADFGSKTEVLLEYDCDPLSDESPGGVERNGLISRIRRCPICR